jgi:type IV pilus assembly protein PilV
MRNSKSHHDHPSCRFQATAGFTLLEVLVALLVLSIGLLGLAALQTVGLKFNQQSYGRTQATLQAYDIIDRIRANKNNNAIVNSAYDNVTLGAAPGSVDCSSSTCDAGQMAEYDIRTWNNINKSVLPQGKGIICRGTLDATFSSCTVGGSVYRIGIAWKEGGKDMRLETETQP